MEIFKNANFDFIGKQKIFIGISVLLMVAGAGSLIVKGGPRYGIDFKGGTVATVRFASAPDEDKIRKALESKVTGEVLVQPVIGQNEVMISTELKSEAELEEAARLVRQTLYSNFHPGQDSDRDFNAMGVEKLAARLAAAVGSSGGSLSEEDARKAAGSIREYRDTPPRSGLIRNFDELKGVEGVTPAVLAALKKEFNLAPFVVRSFEMVGPKMGEELRAQALYVTLAALAGMLVYIAIRFEWIYGLAAVVAVFHDAFVTVGFFSILDKEITITVIAALLTLVGYSMNDTIVIFDRIRENLKLNRKMGYKELVNTSVNQTLSRTVLTSGLTLLTVVSLWLFGGAVLNGFSFALVVGILVGSYSTIFVASPILIWWQNWMESRKKGGPALANPPAAKENNRDAAARAASGKKTASAVKAAK